VKERERAKYYHDHKNDPDIMGEPETVGEPRPRSSYTATITVRFSPQEAELIRQLSEEKRASYSDILREALKVYAETRRPIKGRVITVNYSPESHIELSNPAVVLSPDFVQETGSPTRSITVGAA
jgi:hypothetical protein